MPPVEAGPPFWLLTLVDENERRVHPGQRISDESIPVVIASDQSPIPVTGSIVTDPDVNIHASNGGNLTATGTALDVNIANTSINVIQGTSPWVISGNVAATQSGVWTVNPSSFFPVDQGQAGLPGDAWYMRITDGFSTVGITAFSLNVNVTGSALPTGAATSANQTTMITSLQLLDDLPLAQAASIASQKGVLSFGSVTTAAPAYSTGTVNAISLTTTGALRIDGSVNLTQVGSSSITLGQKTMTNSVPVVIASDQSVLTVKNTSGTSSVTTVSVSTSSTQLLAANSNRKGFIITNLNGTLYVAFGSPASATSYGVSLAASTGNDAYEPKGVVFTGAINAAKGSGTSNVVVTEFT